MPAPLSPLLGDLGVLGRPLPPLTGPRIGTVGSAAAPRQGHQQLQIRPFGRRSSAVAARADRFGLLISLLAIISQEAEMSSAEDRPHTEAEQ
eukprot:Skav202504  [mRNA]  locus=scaffold4864:47382:48425:+ [translate_table: standard]